jgi:hypothetical protein
MAPELAENTQPALVITMKQQGEGCGVLGFVFNRSELPVSGQIPSFFLRFL